MYDDVVHDSRYAYADLGKGRPVDTRNLRWV
jgi:hypothetical protein